ncbi:MAG: formate dehydrogenase accessory protein FdhE [Anaeromyxobacteraceae bacterium]
MSDTASAWVGTPSKGDLGEIPHLVAHPGAAAFRRRAERLAELAPGHAAGEFLALAGRIAAAQVSAAASFRPGPTPAGEDRPLDGSRPPDGWRDALASIAGALAGVPMPQAARDAVSGLPRRHAAELDGLALRVLAGELTQADLAAAPFVGAALQVAFSAHAARIDPASVPRRPDASCPVCGQPPAVGVVQADDKLRHLLCGVCGTEWHKTRLQCVLCASGAKVTYLGLRPAEEGSPEPAPDGEDPARAEACEPCEAYLKLLYREKAPGLEPLADDLASIALDLLVAERGLLRIGRNPYLASAAG